MMAKTGKSAVLSVAVVVAASISADTKVLLIIKTDSHV
jgi:hypothetical protein